MNNRNIIQEQQSIDREVFGDTNINDMGTLKIGNEDVISELQEVGGSVLDIKNAIGEIKVELEEIDKSISGSVWNRNLGDTVNDMSVDLKKLYDQNLQLLKLIDLILKRITWLSVTFIIILILILIK